MKDIHRSTRLRRGSFSAAVAWGVLLYSVTSPSLAQTNQQRAQAATTTATTNAACTALPGFYWEIGDRDAQLASGTRGSTPPTATTQMNVYSASKWVYGAYVYQRRNGILNSNDLRALRMLDGYTETKACLLQSTVGACHSSMSARDTAAIDKFFYASGHFQKHAAVDLNLASSTTSQLATEIHNYLGNDWTFTYSRTDLAGGGRSSAADYAKFLRKILNGTLLLSGGALGSNAVCTYTGPTDPVSGRVNCASALDSPSNEASQYSLGHWVESDPVWLAGGGDPAYSSPGLAGFYPWIDSSRTYYGILARVDLSQGAGAASSSCGRLIRKAWLTATPQ
ncbi:MAG TPA: hypothetical protein VIT67_11010 [Povalibacter sp.]